MGIVKAWSYESNSSATKREDQNAVWRREAMKRKNNTRLSLLGLVLKIEETGVRYRCWHFGKRYIWGFS